LLWVSPGSEKIANYLKLLRVSDKPDLQGTPLLFSHIILVNMSIFLAGKQGKAKGWWVKLPPSSLHFGFFIVLSSTIDQGPCSEDKYSEEMVKNETCAGVRLKYYLLSDGPDHQ